MSTNFVSPNWRMPRNANQSQVSNYSMSFNGTSAFIDISVASSDVVPSRVSDWTYSAWLHLDSTVAGSVPCIFERGLGYPGAGMIVGVKNTDKSIYVYTGGSTTTNFTSITLPTDEWAYFALVYDVSTNGLTCYINNFSQTLTAPASWSIGNTLFNIGKRQNNHSSYFWKGKMDQVAVFDYALSSSQITTLYGDSTSGTGNPMALPSAPIAYYPLGTSAWNGQYLAENNAIEDYVFDFNGSNNYVDASYSGNLPALSLWFKPNSTITTSTTPQYIINCGGDWNGIGFGAFTGALTNELIIVSDANIAGRSAYTEASGTISAKWHHLVINWSGSVYEIWLDGTNVQNATTGTPQLINATDLQIGRRSSSPNYNFNGEISNVQIFNAALPATGSNSIETLYNNGSPLASMTGFTSLQNWYKLDASEVFNATAPYYSTQWSVNQAAAAYQSSSFCPNVSSQTVTDYLEVSNYSGTTGKSAASWSFWYNALESNNQGGALSGTIAEFKRNAAGQYAGMEFTLYTEVAGVDKTFSTKTFNHGGRYMDMSAAGNDAGIQGIGNWVNIVLVYDGNDPVAGQSELGSIKAYANGAQGFVPGGGNAYNGKYPAEGTIKTGKLIFGGGDFATRHMSASLSNYATWDKALTQAEVNEIVNNGQPKNLSTHSASSNLISWWTLENLTTGLVDTIGGYNASIVGSNSYIDTQSVSQLNGKSSGMTQANLIQSDLQTVAPYSKYALSFDGTLDTVLLGNAPIVTGVFTMSMWIKRTSTTSPGSHANQALIAKDDISSNRVYNLFFNTSTGVLSFFVSSNGSYNVALRVDTSTAINDTEWHNVVFINNGNNVKNQIYVDGAEASYTAQGTGVSSLHSSTINSTACGLEYLGANYFYGSMSNISMWTSSFSPSQVREIYNEGLPSNLNLHSSIGSIASWWQCGENSSFNVNWTCENEVASNNGVTRSVPEVALTNGVGTTANGVSTGMLESSLVGDAPYSTANASSINMTVTARGTDVPS